MRQSITSNSNPKIKAASKLRTRRGRKEQHRTIIDGVREVHRAGQSGFEFAEIYLCEELLTGAEAAELGAWIEANPELPVFDLSQDIMEKIAFGNRAEGAVAVIGYPESSLNEFQPSASSLIVVVEGIEKPGNVGAILRTADAVGADCVISADGRTDLFNPNAIRASLGTIFSVPIYETTSEHAKQFLQQRDIPVFAARVDGSCSYIEANYTAACAIALGSEADGLSDHWIGDGIQNIHLPMRGIADSLNVSTAAAALLYEVIRQRG
ncbi:MAG: TrmH family RNA methyltransferase [Pirellulales bacterium]|jgi:TrmH family RNA methyltransferase